jgi:PAS domain S-box-containing protein
LNAALSRLAEVGIAVREGSSNGPWLVVQTEERTLALDVAGEASDELRSVLRPLLQLALRRAAEQSTHKHTSERLEMLSVASFEGILIHVDGVVIEVNQRLSEISGWTREELLGSGAIPRTVAPEDVAATIERVRSGFEGTYVITAIRKDGTRFPAELQSKQSRLGDRPVRVAAVRDISERERTLSLLRQSEQHLHDLALGAFDFMVVSQDGLIVDVGGNVERVLGFTREHMVGRPPLHFVAPSARPLTAEVLAENRPGAYQSVLIDAAGEELPVEIVGVRSTLAGKPARVAGFRDLRSVRQLERERRTLEQQLERSQRIDSLGVLAGGIAHDFNNLLVGVLGNASLLLNMLEAPLAREAAKAIVTAGERAATLTRQMLAYAGHQDLGRREPFDLGALFRELRTLLDATLSKKATLTFEVEPSSIVLGDRATITQVMMNLLTNASDALQGKPGRIDIRARHVRELDARWDDALGASVGPGDWVLVEIADNGIGMDEATRLRVFEPFFSTKENGHGLGLAACLGIITSHGGALLLESEPGRGSCFSLVLPSAEHHAPSVPTKPPSNAPKPCRVLVVDDEELVRTQLRRSLERRGYAVEEASDGLSGVTAAARLEPDVLIIDMTMPDIDGAEVVRRVRAAGSRAAIVLSSGYQAAAAAERLGPDAYQVFLPKPFGLNELVDAVEKARTLV